MKFGRVNLTVTLVSNPNDWTTSSALVTFMGPYLAVYWVDENEVICIFSEYTAKELEQALEHQAASIHSSSRDCFSFSKLETVEDKVERIGIYQDLVFYLEDAPGSRTVSQWYQDNKIAEGLRRSVLRF